MAPPKFMGLTGRPLSLAVSTVATTGFVLFGYDQGVMSGIITAPAFNDLFAATKNNSTMQGFVTAIYEIGTSPFSAPRLHQEAQIPTSNC